MEYGEGIVTPRRVKEIAGLMLDFLKYEPVFRLDYAERNPLERVLLPLDSDLNYFLELDPGMQVFGKRTTAILCIPGDLALREKEGDFYEKLTYSFIQAFPDDSILGSFITLKCEKLIREYIQKGFDGYGNVIQQRMLGTLGYSKSGWVKFIGPQRISLIKKELERLVRIL
jgi:hypothetical protein